MDIDHSYIFSLARNASKLSQIHRTSGDEMLAEIRLHFLGPLMSTPELACMCQSSYPKHLNSYALHISTQGASPLHPHLLKAKLSENASSLWSK